MINGTMKVNVSHRFNGEGKVYAFNVRIDNELHAEVSRDKAWSLIIQAQDVAEDIGYMCDVRGMDYLRAAR